MRTLYISYPEDDLIEGIFDQDGTLLDFWSPNDACFREEYFGPFLKKLGFNVEYAPEWMDDILRRKAMEEYGLSAEDVGLG